MFKSFLLHLQVNLGLREKNKIVLATQLQNKQVAGMLKFEI